MCIIHTVYVIQNEREFTRFMLDFVSPYAPCLIKWLTGLTYDQNIAFEFGSTQIASCFNVHLQIKLIIYSRKTMLTFGWVKSVFLGELTLNRCSNLLSTHHRLNCPSNYSPDCSSHPIVYLLYINCLSTLHQLFILHLI